MPNAGSCNVEWSTVSELWDILIPFMVATWHNGPKCTRGCKFFAESLFITSISPPSIAAYSKLVSGHRTNPIAIPSPSLPINMTPFFSSLIARFESSVRQLAKFIYNKSSPSVFVQLLHRGKKLFLFRMKVETETIFPM